MDNVLNCGFDFDTFWSRCDDLFIIVFSLLLVTVGIFIGFNIPTKHVFHNIMWRCNHEEEEVKVDEDKVDGDVILMKKKK